jgi:glycosyltransferase involved in cell wall biosynthesis
MNSLCVAMIVRDAEGLLPACLVSVRDVAQEIVVADTGSSDSTISIAKQYGTRVLQIPWTNDFSAARNRALAEARCDWVLSMDADERLDSTAWSRLPQLLENTSVAGYQISIRNYLGNPAERIWDQPAKANDSLLLSSAVYPVFGEQKAIRLFRRDPKIYFVGKLHESVEPRITAIRSPVGQADFCVHHFGFVVDRAAKAKKNQMYREIGRQKLKETPGDWQAHLELGMLECEQFRNLVEAQRLFLQAADLNPSEGSIWFFLGLTHFRMGAFEDAVKTLRKSENCGYRTAMVAETRGDAHYNLGQFDEARASFEFALKREARNRTVEAKLGLATVRAGGPDRGLAQLREALGEAPQCAELHEGLVLAFLYLDRVEDAAKAASHKLDVLTDLFPGDYLRAASLWAQLQDWQRSARALELGLVLHPGNGELNRAHSEVMQAAGTLEMKTLS